MSTEKVTVHKVKNVYKSDDGYNVELTIKDVFGNRHEITITRSTLEEVQKLQKDTEIELTKARTLKDSNEITAGGLSDKLLAYKALEVQEKMAENKSAIFVPYEALNTPGLSNRIFNTDSK